MTGLLDRKLDRYPANGPRTAYLGISVLATIVLYYELYVQGAIATKLLSDFHISFVYLVGILVIGNALGALASFAAGLADRWGRGNIVAVGLVLTGVLTEWVLPATHTGLSYGVAFSALTIVEGAVLVASPALIRDFSPQLGRASAMGFWTLGPVLGSLVVTTVSSHTLTHHTDWRYQYHVAGWAGLAIAVVAVIGLRELSPALRDQLMVSLKDKALIEARAAGIDVDAVQKDSLRHMLKLDVVVPSFAISFQLIAYYILVAFFVVFMATTFGYSEQRANALASWYWVSNAIALVVAGLLSDRIRVRKPLMVVGGVISAGALAVFASKATDTSTSYYTLAAILTVMAAGGGIAYVAWMAAFTETVEKHNPAATATGLSLWGLILRSVVAVVFLVLPLIVSSVGRIVDDGPRALALQAKYKPQIAIAQKLDPATSAALAKNPNDTLALLAALTKLSGAPQDVVIKSGTLLQKYPDELQTANAISPATQIQLLTSPTDPATQGAAVKEIAAGRHVDAAKAAADLAALAAVPQADLIYLSTTGKPVVDAATALQALTLVPKADLAFLQTQGAKIQKAQKDVPGQWQTFFWIAFVGQLLFLPCAWIVTGRWSPSKAREDAEVHARAVEEELQAISAGAS